jgi:hypothetical protein
MFFFRHSDDLTNNPFRFEVSILEKENCVNVSLSVYSQ